MRENASKKFKKTKLLLAVMLAFMLSMSFAPAAYADPIEPGDISEAAITKILKVPVGTDVPTVTFTFDVVGVSINDDPSLQSSVPVVGTASASFPSGSYQAIETVGDSTYYCLETAELFGGIVWPHTGIFEYMITELPSGYALVAGETLTESLAVYRVRVHVREDATTGDLYIWGIGAYRIIEDDGTDIGPVGEKVDPTPGGGSNPAWDYSQMTFGNIYTKHKGGGGEDPNMDTLTISKIVGGDYSSVSYYFDYSLTINKPSLVDAAITSYRAYIVEGSPATVVTNLTPNKVAAGLIATDSSGVTCINVPIGTAFTFALQHGQSLVFTNAHVGANYTITEFGVSGYLPKVTVTSNGATPGVIDGALSSDFTVPDGTVILTNPLVGEASNSVAFNNRADGIGETGITIENLPFIGIIALAILGLGAFIFVRSRKRRLEN